MSLMEYDSYLQTGDAYEEKEEPVTTKVLHYDKAAFQERLREICFIRGMTQQSLAEQLGVSEPTISRYASGNRTPNLETMVALADVLNVRLDTLIGRDTPPEYGDVQEKLQECRGKFF